MMTEPMPNDDILLSPSEAVEWLKVHRGETAMTVNILRQMRHRGRIQALQFGGKNSRITLYRIGDLRTADFTRQKAGRKAKSEQATRYRLNPLK
jgi:hypothetical protein